MPIIRRYIPENLLDAIKDVDGSGSGLDADLLDGYDSSTSPTPNSIPVSNSQGKLDPGWLDVVIGESALSYIFAYERFV